MKKKNKICLILFLIAYITVFFESSKVLATEPSGVSGIAPNTTQIASFDKAINVTIGIFQVVTIAIGVIMLIALAIKYMSSAPGEKAEIKQHAVVYIVGAVLAFGATGVITMIKDIVVDLSKDI